MYVPECISFGLDPGAVSGWAIALNPELPYVFGTTNSISERKEACRTVFELSVRLGLPIVVVAEEWTAGGPRANYKMFVGLGKNYGRWLDHIELILRIPEDQILRVTQQKWRNGLFGGKTIAKYCPRPNVGDKLKRLACAYVSPWGSEPCKDHNAAEAACIACWAHCSEEGVIAAERAISRFDYE